MRRAFLATFSVLVAAALGPSLSAPLSGQTGPDLGQLYQNYEKKDAMIPMRDAVRLHTEIYFQKNSSVPLPFLITRCLP